jgi:hypothetical protein
VAEQLHDVPYAWTRVGSLAGTGTFELFFNAVTNSIVAAGTYLNSSARHKTATPTVQTYGSSSSPPTPSDGSLSD